MITPDAPSAMPASGFYILFAGGARPNLASVLELADTGAGFAVVHEDAGQGLAELLQHGLSFDLTGLAPWEGVAAPAIAHPFGLAVQGIPQGEWVVLRPGAHLSGGHHLLPVMRAMVELALALLALPQARALCWAPARTVMAPDYARHVLAPWLAGGAFPALGLTALGQAGDSSFASTGMEFFTGQELRITPSVAPDWARAAPIAFHLIHRLVSQGGEVSSPIEVAGPQGEPLLLQPMADGREIWVQSAKENGL
ncbi:hypothetical protein EOE18_04785 [Novosphingobium umbonatum]|uniref:DUF4261 domain-containing protein n=1 Tax=Novosphingobium umbonatum TaxID=1908524 RepID=A0A3S2VUJ0_9SPHN|nr:hypothetical protein [Novosphingobium umbonatum]RVU06163.1 hypothetical protein EOE18_04785 [Novosphingobium umbonatum]